MKIRKFVHLVLAPAIQFIRVSLRDTETVGVDSSMRGSAREEIHFLRREVFELPQLCRTLRLRLLCASRDATWPDESIESGHSAEGLGGKFVVGGLTG